MPHKVFEWHKMFKEGRELVEDCSNRCSGGQSEKSFGLLQVFTIALISEMKRELKGHRFDSIETVQVAMTKALNSIPETDFQRTKLSLSMQEECILKIIK
jgi:hypothetical protein